VWLYTDHNNGTWRESCIQLCDHPVMVPPPLPRARWGAGLAQDRNGKMVLFGGCTTDTTACPSNVGSTGLGVTAETWLHDNATGLWTLARPEHSPPARLGAAMIRIPATGDVLLYGGQSQNGTLLADTWIWNGTDWIQRFAAALPGPLVWPGLAHDSTNRIVMFGGCSAQVGGGCTTLSNRTYRWDSSTNTWGLPCSGGICPGAPSGRLVGSQMARDRSGKVVLVGGWDGSVYRNDVYTWDGGTATWTSITTNTPPAGRSGGIAATVSHAGNFRILVTGGGNGGGLLSDAWLLSLTGSNTGLWIPFSCIPAANPCSPPPRHAPAFAMTTSDYRAWIFGGLNSLSRALGDGWILEPACASAYCF
jgi:hypothetical protein